jgi:2-polyprenyl-3-methyl-5-hydroxy-6-metoxy-1,4-benzoquinol methylase
MDPSQSATTRSDREGAVVTMTIRFARLLQRATAWVPKRRYAIPRDVWEAEYSAGKWDYLRQIGELPRYSIIVGYCRHFKPQGAVLDVGCGQGLLAPLIRESCSRYLGVDLSSEAVQYPVTLEDAKTQFRQGDASTFVPDGKFDVIVFNEMLYYLEQPLETVRRYAPFLSDGGIFITSNVVSRRSFAARRALAAAYSPLAWVRVESRDDIAWQVQVIEAPRLPAND